MSARAYPLGIAAIALAIFFNIPYAVLAAIFDYPMILREPAGGILARFAAGGPVLLLAWYGFALAALALTPLAIGLSITARRLVEHPALAIGAAVSGALAGVAQAIGLMRWVFVVPALARDATSGDPGAAAAAAHAFDLIHAYGGVAIGEHLGQLLTASFAAQLALLQAREQRHVPAMIGLATSAALVIGTGEALAIALDRDGGMFALATIAGFLGLTAWLIATGIALLRRA